MLGSGLGLLTISRRLRAPRDATGQHPDEWLGTAFSRTELCYIGSQKPQGAEHSHPIVSQQTGTYPCTTSSSALFRCFAAGRSSRTPQTDLSPFYFASAISILTRDIHIAILSVRPSVRRLSVRNAPVLDENGLTYRHSFFTILF